MKAQSINSTDPNTIDLKEIELKKNGFRQIVNEYEMKDCYLLPL